MSEYDKLSEERKALQEQGLLPDWFTTGSWQVFKSKYLYGANPKEHYTRIAKTLANHTKEPTVWETKFFNLLWKGWLSPSTPVLSNTGTSRGLTISCAGNYIEDTVEGFFTSLTETAVLSKNGFGTSSYLSDIRPRGSKISTGGKSSGVLPVLKMNIQASIDISQGGVRRGAWAGYLDIDHGDFWEVYHYLENNPDDCNIGWIIGDKFINRLNSGDEDALERYQAVLKLKCMLGKGYFHFKDKVNRLRPETYKKHNLDVKASNLCVAPETLILTKEHGYKEISSLENQDVHVWNGEEWSLTTVRQTSENSELIKVTFDDDSYIDCTKEHKFYVSNRDVLLSYPPQEKIIQINAINLRKGDKLESWVTANGKEDTNTVKLVEITNRFDKTYCFTEPKRNRGMFNGVVTGQCDEIELHSSKDYTFTCCLSSMNLAKYNEWKDTDAVFDATVFLDCIVSEFLDKAKHIRHLEKAIAFTEKGRAVGLGVMGLFSYFQQEMIDPESIDAHVANTKIFQHLDKESLRASRWLAREYGEPEWCKGFGIRNTHRCVSGDTKLLTKEGYKNIKELVGVEVEIWNGKQWTIVTPFKTSENEKIYRVELSNGDFLDCTYDHKWLIKNNRYAKSLKVETQNLTIGDKLEKWSYPVIDGYNELKYAYAGGFFTGDGSYSQSKPQYPNCKKRKDMRIYCDKKKICMSKLPIKDDCKVRIISNNGVRFYLDDEVPEKWFVPDITYSVYSRLQWLSGLFDSDGSNNGSITSHSKDFLLKVKELGISCGLFCTVRDVVRTGGYSHGKDEKSTYYKLDFSQKQLIDSMKLGFEPLRVNFNKTTRTTQVFVKINSIKEIGISDTYCVTDSKDGCALFNNIMTAQCALAPTKSTGAIMGGVSEGINPFISNVFVSSTASGDINRINPVLLDIMKKRGVYNQETISFIEENKGSVKNVDWLNDHEKKVFKTAFELDQLKLLKLASNRQRYIDQGQSLNLFILKRDEGTEEFVSMIHQYAFMDKFIKGLYYIYSDSVSKAESTARILSENNNGECESCQ